MQLGLRTLIQLKEKCCYLEGSPAKIGKQWCMVLNVLLLISESDHTYGCAFVNDSVCSTPTHRRVALRPLVDGYYNSLFLTQKLASLREFTDVRVRCIWEAVCVGVYSGGEGNEQNKWQQSFTLSLSPNANMYGRCHLLSLLCTTP